MLRKTFFFVATIALFFSLGCDRLSVNSTVVSLKVPKNISNKVMPQSADLVLVHLVVQVTGADISQPIMEVRSHRFFYKSGIEPEIALEVPNGPNRLIQVLAAYQPTDQDGGAALYYGDVSRSINATEVIDVPLTQLQEGNATEGVVHGRYLDGPNSGPTGMLKSFYQPENKPQIFFDESMMIGGWFEAMSFGAIPLNYYLPNGESLGKQWVSNNIPVGNHRIRILEPAYKSEQWDENTNTTIWEDRGPRANTFGFFAKNESLLTGKKICIESYFGNYGTLYSGEHKLSEHQRDLAPIVHSIGGNTQPPNAVSIVGGLPYNDCAVLPEVEEYVSHIKIKAFYTHLNMAWDFISEITRLFPLRAFSNERDYGVGYYNPSYKMGADVKGAYLALKPLPGTASYLTHFRFYEKDGDNDSYNPSLVCNSNLANFDGWISKSHGTLPALNAGTYKLYKEDLNIGSSPEAHNILCVGRANELLATEVEIDQHSFMYTAPADSFAISTYSPQIPAVPSVENSCIPIQVALTAQIQGVPERVPNSNSNLKYTVNALKSGVPTNILYQDSDCSSGTENNKLTSISFPLFDRASTFYIKAAAGDYTLKIESDDASLPAFTGLFPIVAAPTGFDRLRLSLDSGNLIENEDFSLYPQGCHPVVATLLAVDGQTLSTSGANATLSLMDSSDNAITPAGFLFVDSCQNPSNSNSGSITFIDGKAHFGIVTGPSILEDIKLKFSLTNGIIAEQIFPLNAPYGP